MHTSWHRWLTLPFPTFSYRHEKVQENCIDLVGRIADRGAEFVPAKEWMRICFELLELLKAHKKAIRRATVNTFGYIAKAIGWVDSTHSSHNPSSFHPPPTPLTPTAPKMCWPLCWTTSRYRSVRIVFAPLSPLPLLPRPAPHSPSCRPSWTSIVFLSWMFRMGSSNLSPSCLSTLGRWGRTTSTPWLHYWRMLSWTGRIPNSPCPPVAAIDSSLPYWGAMSCPEIVGWTSKTSLSFSSTAQLMLYLSDACSCRDESALVYWIHRLLWVEFTVAHPLKPLSASSGSTWSPGDTPITSEACQMFVLVRSTV